MSEIQDRINSLRGDAEIWGHVSYRLTNDMFNVKMLQNFFNMWQTQGYEAAVDALPDDKPNTEVNEGITVEELKSTYGKIKTMLEKSSLNIQMGEFPDSNAPQQELAGTLASLQENSKTAARMFMGRQMIAQYTRDDIGREIEELHSAQDDKEIDVDSGSSSSSDNP